MKSLIKKAFATAAAAAVISVPAIVSPGIAGAMTLDEYTATAQNAGQATLVSEGDATYEGKDSNGKPANTGWRDSKFPDSFKEAVKNGRVTELWYKSPSMGGREIPLLWLKPDPSIVDAATAKPTLYYLNGGDGGEGTANWMYRTDIIDFFADKNVNVIIPMAGQFSYYTDWIEEDANLGGKQKWETFLTKELPGPLEEHIHGNGLRGIEGMSMSATSSLALAEHNPGFYNAVASFSGCADTSTPLGTTAVQATFFWGGLQGVEQKMWGQPGNDIWRYNSALLHSDQLAGTAERPLHVYVSNSSGLMGEHDTSDSKYIQGNGAAAATQIGIGGAIEGATNMCTHDLQAKLQRDGTNPNVHFEFRNSGTHSWLYWQDDMHKSWDTTFAPAFGM